MQGRLNAVKGKLDNSNFINRAPKNVVTHEIEKKERYTSALTKLKENLQSLI